MNSVYHWLNTKYPEATIIFIEAYKNKDIILKLSDAHGKAIINNVKVKFKFNTSKRGVEFIDAFSKSEFKNFIKSYDQCAKSGKSTFICISENSYPVVAFMLKYNEIHYQGPNEFRDREWVFLSDSYSAFVKKHLNK